MICSMTAFARQEIRGDFGLLACEIRSVNHRHLELALRKSSTRIVEWLPLHMR